MSLRVVSDFESESQMALYAKWDKVKLIFLIVSLEQCKFLQTTPNIRNIYISNLSSLNAGQESGVYTSIINFVWPKSQDFTVEPHRKSYDSPGMMDMGKKLSSRAIDWRWNHNDPTVESSKNAPGSHGGPPPNSPHRQHTALHPALLLQVSSFRLPLVTMSWSVHSLDAGRSFKRRWSWCWLEKEKKKKKEKKKEEEDTGKRGIPMANKELRFL